jgi:cysteine desulfurase/selenocysteine lyase
LCELPGVRFLDEKQPNDAPIISFCVNNAHPHDICQILASHQVAARGGHHCAQPLMQHWDIDGSVRFSLAPYNTANDIDAAITGVTEALQLLQ